MSGVAGRPDTIAFTLTNAGPDATAATLTVSAGGTTLVSIAPTTGSFNGGTWSPGPLAAGQTATLTLAATAPAAGTFSIGASVVSNSATDRSQPPPWTTPLTLSRTITLNATPAIAPCPTRPMFNSVIFKDGVTSFYYRPQPGQTVRGAKRFGKKLSSMLNTATGRARLPRVEYTTDRPVDAKRLPSFARKVGPRRVVTAILSNADATRYSGIRLAYRPKKGTYAKLLLPAGSVTTLRTDCPKVTGYGTIYAKNILVNRASK